MYDRDDSAPALLSFLIGGIIGASVTCLLAPQSGIALRRRIRKGVDDRVRRGRAACAPSVRRPARSRSRGYPPRWAGAGVDSPLVPVFVAIIAIAALMQAIFVVGLAIAMRIANARMGELHETLEREIAKPIAEMTRVADLAVRASEQTLVQAERMGAAVAEASTKIESVIGDVTRKLQAAGDDLEEAAEEIEEDVIEPARDQLSGVAAVFRGVQRAMEVWRETSPRR